MKKNPVVLWGDNCLKFRRTCPAEPRTWACGRPARTSTTTSPSSARGPTTTSCCATGRRSSCAPCKAPADQAGQGLLPRQALRVGPRAGDHPGQAAQGLAAGAQAGRGHKAPGAPHGGAGGAAGQAAGGTRAAPSCSSRTRPASLTLREARRQLMAAWREAKTLNQKYRGQRLAGLAHEIFLKLLKAKREVPGAAERQKTLAAQDGKRALRGCGLMAGTCELDHVVPVRQAFAGPEFGEPRGARRHGVRPEPQAACAASATGWPTPPSPCPSCARRTALSPWTACCRTWALWRAAATRGSPA